MEERADTDLGYVEVIGYWRGEFRVLYCKQHPDLASAQHEAEQTFRALPVRFLADRGVVVRECSAVRVTGEWPTRWVITRVQDLGVLCAYLYEGCVATGQTARAKQFRAMIVPASPATEQLLAYVAALEFAERSFVADLAPPFRNALRAGIKAAQTMLHR